jgi:hypothetical protein
LKSALDAREIEPRAKSPEWNALGLLYFHHGPLGRSWLDGSVRLCEKEASEASQIIENTAAVGQMCRKQVEFVSYYEESISAPLCTILFRLGYIRVYLFA